MRLLFAELNLPYLLNDIEYPLGGATIRMHAFMLGLIEDGHQVGCIVYNGLECKNKDKHNNNGTIE